MLEIDIAGVYIPAALLWAGVAYVLSALISRVLNRTGFYELVWHRALFDFSVFVILWVAISAIPYYLAFRSGWPPSP